MKIISIYYQIGLFYSASIEDKKVAEIFNNEKPDIVVNLAAQAGVRHSLTNPWSYTNTNLVDLGIFSKVVVR